MNYLYLYNRIIKNRQTNPLSNDEYGENHHIIPLCMGGPDEKSNIIKLSYKEHYIAHACLYKHFKTSSLAHAWFSMCRTSSNQKRDITPSQYEKAKIAHVEALKETMQGEGNHFYGKKHTDATKKAIGSANKGRKKSQKEIDNWVEKVAKKPNSKEHRAKIGRKGLVMLQNIHTLEIIRAKRDDYDPNIWVNPRKITPEKRYKCIHCGIESNRGNIERWHNDKCKQRQMAID